MGSYDCDCNPGYRLASDGFTCNDIDECADNSDGCAQNCTNTEEAILVPVVLVTAWPVIDIGVWVSKRCIH